MSSKPAANPRKQPRQARSQATVAAILTATTHILTESGYAQLTTNRVAERAGVSIGSLYQYFPNKEALLVALAEHHAQAMMQLAQHHLADLRDRSLPEVLRQLVKAAIAAHTVNPQLHRVLQEQVPQREVMQRLDQTQAEDLLRSLLAQHADQLRPQNLELTVFLVERTIRGLIHGAICDRPEWLKTAEFEQELVVMLSRYLLQ